MIKLTRTLRLKPTPVWDAYWAFAAERQSIFFRRVAGDPPPWTQDSILREYKFTNAYRAADRVTQFLIRRVIYRADLPSSPTEVCFRTLLFKFFNKIETWQLLEAEFGTVTYNDFKLHWYEKVLKQALRAGRRIYSGAYIIPSGSSVFGYGLKHQNQLRLLELMMADALPDKLAAASSMREAFEHLHRYPTIGGFLAYQFLIDINYSEVINFSEMEFVAAGPGALGGIRKCFANAGAVSAEDIIRFLADAQEAEFERRGITFRSLWGRRLQLIDCQNLLCEIDKYARVAFPDIVEGSGRRRIKQKYGYTGGAIDYWFPPKWKLNELVMGAQPLRDNRGLHGLT